MDITDVLDRTPPQQSRYGFRLCRAVLLCALGAIMHLPSPDGVTPPVVSPLEFVRLSAHRAEADAPAIVVKQSIVFAPLLAEVGVLEAGNTALDAPVGTTGTTGTEGPVALAEFQSAESSDVVAEVPVPVEDFPAIAPLPARDSPRASSAATEPPRNRVIASATDVRTAVEPLPPPGATVSSSASNLRLQPIANVARRAIDEEERVRQLLDEYAGAFERLDVGATQAVYPTVDGKALKRAFQQLSSQRLTLESCGITISGSTANARCRGSATYQPRIGTRPVQIASREWTFDLSKQDTAWRIVNTFVR